MPEEAQLMGEEGNELGIVEGVELAKRIAGRYNDHSRLVSMLSDCIYELGTWEGTPEEDAGNLHNVLKAARDLYDSICPDGEPIRKEEDN